MRLLFANERRIYSYIYLLIPCRADAEDLFQETLSIMWTKFDHFEEGKDFGSWGIGIAHHVIQNYRRKKGHGPLYLGEEIEGLLEEEAHQSIKAIDFRIEALRQCLTELNPLDRRIIHWRYEDEISVKSIAEKMCTTIKVIYVKLARAHDILLRCIRRTLAEQGSE